MKGTISPVFPGATIGVLGSGQLGRMFTLAARRLGYRVHTYSPDTDTPTGQVADLEVSGEYEDIDRVLEFARDVQVITFEFENVPTLTVEAIDKMVPVRPGGHVLHIAQNRNREKQFLSDHGLPHAPMRYVSSREQFDLAITELGTPVVLKTAGFGYDGKGQIRVYRLSEAASAWHNIESKDCVVEKWIDFDREISVIGVRTEDGQFAHYNPIVNSHRNHILDISTAPADISRKAERTAVDITRTICEELDLVGLLCVEFFLTSDNDLLVNEIAPRPHNSGHLTIDACRTSQFEQQLRAICCLPLGDSSQMCPAAMANLLGELWTDNTTPNWAKVMEIPSVNLHLYGKDEARPGRKMGHITALAHSVESAESCVRAARKALRPDFN